MSKMKRPSMQKPSMGSAQSKNVNRMRREREKKKAAKLIKKLLKEARKQTKIIVKRRVKRPGPTRSPEAIGMVVSPRGRDLARPQADWEPSPDMPQSKQDFFLTSRAIRTMAYDYKTRTLQLQWQSGDVYNYYKVPELTWIALKNAPSKGRFAYYRIRTSFNFKKIN